MSVRVTQCSCSYRLILGFNHTISPDGSRYRSGTVGVPWICQRGVKWGRSLVISVCWGPRSPGFTEVLTPAFFLRQNRSTIHISVKCRRDVFYALTSAMRLWKQNIGISNRRSYLSCWSFLFFVHHTEIYKDKKQCQSIINNDVSIYIMMSTILYLIYLFRTVT